ncbi:MAG TPA: outer membrane protein transport protein [Vicinamibacterales bacterium]|nr:outer membrane protein transport protein [Vicinamibacterales bacterium]
MTRRVSLWCLAALGVLVTSHPAAAQGYGVYEQGACAMGRAGAAVASPCDDGSAIFFNPAAIALQTDGSRVAAGGTLVGPRGDFTGAGGRTSGTMVKNWLPVPAAYYTKSLGERLGGGVGVFAPFGLTTDWPVDFAGRFVAYKTVLQSIYLQPTLAYKVNDAFAVGGGLDVVYSTLELNQRVDLATQQAAPGTTFAQMGVPLGTDFANVRISGQDVSFAGHVGVLITATDKVSFGGRYLSRHTIKVDHLDLDTDQIPTGLRTPVPLPGIPVGTPLDVLVGSQFAPGARLSDQQAATRLTVPDQIVAGVAVTPFAPLKLLADYQFTAWSVFDSLAFASSRGLDEVIVKNYRNTSGVRVGADYAATERVALRAGVLTHQAAAPEGSVTPDLPEGARTEYTAGLGARVSRGLVIDVAYQHIAQQDRSGRVLLRGPNTGTYAFHANLFGATATVRF